MKKLDKTGILAGNPWLSDVKIKASSSSTQQDAKADGQDRCLYLAEQQTATYGRFGREFFSADEGGIYMSLLLQVNPSESMPQYTVLAGAAVVSAIKKLTDKPVQIKWVNDIYLEGKKICGILAEAHQKADGRLEIIIGIGLNFAIREFPEPLKDKAGSLFNSPDEANIDRNQLISEIWQAFDRLKNADYLSIYTEHSLVLGRQVTFSQQGRDYEGIARDLTANAGLIVELAGGQEMVLSSGEVSLKSW
ncbi:biotin--[acetyl-CoA-carboxylase] ligase [Lactococcus termiticola]|uniref:biotin--[biotin carboxyl-carrier protein] ligase n=1 Tax=Lactococcus termiticola TaxID=2169526 RepID=A0A2R5HFZ3_9LACT|nr:biotin--[acetyl-CoA-carboxylase] ligase [Lactococcus termiticola]GBG96983.1 biotin-[acetyl-CoA-carboxylase] ligase [Lactococcus termiticola]